MVSSFKNVLECRHQSMCNKEVFSKLTSNNITFCGMRHPLYLEEVIQNTWTVYYRFHGKPNLYQSPYTLPQLKRFTSEIKAHKETTESFLYFNNDIDGSAIKNAQQMKKLMAAQV